MKKQVFDNTLAEMLKDREHFMQLLSSGTGDSREIIDRLREIDERIKWLERTQDRELLKG